MIVDRDMGYREAMRRLLGESDSHVYVGIRQDQGETVAEGDDINLAGIAAVNEFGSDDGHIPERSFLRSTVDENRSEYADVLQRLVENHVDGKAHIDDSINELGVRAVRDVQTKIRTLREPENADSTKKKKKSDNPLIDTGRLRQSIDYEVRK